MINAMLITSACDCSIAIAEGTCGSEAKFVKKMNAMAKEIGCKTTNELLKTKKYRCIGKTGTGTTAKCCFAGVYKYKGHTYIFDVIKPNSYTHRHIEQAI